MKNKKRKILSVFNVHTHQNVSPGDKIKESEEGVPAKEVSSISLEPDVLGVPLKEKTIKIKFTDDTYLIEEASHFQISRGKVNN